MAEPAAPGRTRKSPRENRSLSWYPCPEVDLNGYFDCNATTPLLPAAREMMLHALDEQWQNPSSLYREAGAVRRALEEAREHLAERLGIDDPERILFTSGATEANNILLRHVAATASSDAPVYISEVEHPCVRQPAHDLFRARLEELPADPEPLARRLADRRPGLVSIMAANNETGILHPWRELGDLCRHHGISFHTDAAQWIGKRSLQGLGDCDWITGSAHKFGGPKGAGFLVVPPSLRELVGAAQGGPQEQGRRGGTENVPAILAMIAALEEAECLRTRVNDQGRNLFETRLREAIPEVRIVGGDHARLWNTSLFVLPEFGNLKWLIQLSDAGFQVSTGSACSSGRENPSHVMEAMGLDYSEMGRVIRASGHWQTSEDDWVSLADAIASTWTDLRNPKSRKERSKRTVNL